MWSYWVSSTKFDKELGGSIKKKIKGQKEKISVKGGSAFYGNKLQAKSKNMSQEQPKHPLVEAEKQIREIEEKRRTYEENVSDVVNDNTSLLEKITGTGITKMDVMHTDAEDENFHRRLDKDYPPEHSVNSEERIEERKMREDANVIMQEKEGFATIFKTLNGDISGKDIEITQKISRNKDDTKWDYEIVSSATSPFFDGKRLDVADAEKIFENIESKQKAGIFTSELSRKP